MTAETRQKLIDNLLIPFLAVLSGLLLASIFVLMTGNSPITAYRRLFEAGFSCGSYSNCALFTTFQFATPMILTGLSAVVAFRSGLFSLGQEGQLMLGGLMAAWLGYIIHLPPIIHPAFIILVAMLVGGVYGLFPGILKVKLGVNELISTLVLNNIAVLFVRYLINFPLRADQSTTAHTRVIDETAKLMTFAPNTKWGVGFILAILATVLVFIYLWRSAPGYEQRMAGQAPFFARFGGIPSDGAAIRGMFISGMLAGLAGAIQVLGVHYRMLDGFSAGLGFDGVTAAILGQTHPIGTAIVAVFFAGVRMGAQVGLQLALKIPRELGGGVIALMILFVAADQFYRNNIDRISAFFKRLRGRKSVEEEA